MTRLLAIDDDPGRYAYLVQLLEESGADVQLEVATCSTCVLDLLHQADAVLLDYDLDSGELCASCGGWVDRDKGREYLDELGARGVPVIVSSASSYANRRLLTHGLRERGVTTAELSASENDPELKWLGRLWAWGVL